MTYARVIVAAALQRYIEPPPVAVRAREAGIAMAREHGAPVFVIAVDAPVALLPDVESTGEKLDRFVEPIRDAGIEVHPRLMSGKPSKKILEFLAGTGAGESLLIVGSQSKRDILDVGMGGTARALLKESPCPLLMVCPTRQEAKRARELMIPGYPFVFPYG